MIICLILILFFIVRNIHFYLICILVIPYALNLNLSLNLILYLIYAESEFQLKSSVVPLDVDFLESKCTNHVARSTYTSDMLYEVQAVEPSSSPTLVLPTVQPPPTLE